MLRILNSNKIYIMIEIRYVKLNDKEFWYSLDKHLPDIEFNNKVNLRDSMSH